MGTVLEKAFRILGLDERKSRWVVKEDFHGFEILGYVTVFCLFFSSLLLVGFERSLHPAQVRGPKCPWPLKLMFTGGRRDVARSAQVVLDGSGVNRLSSLLFCVDILF